jgi:hypothetical protein
MKVWWRSDGREFHTFDSKYCDANLAIEELFETMIRDIIEKNTLSTLDMLKVIEVKETFIGPIRKYSFQRFDDECCVTQVL